MAHTNDHRVAVGNGLTTMSATLNSLEEAARLIRAGASVQGPYVLEHCIALAGQRAASLSPRQSLRVARKEWKTVPSTVMDQLRAAYRALELKAEAFADHQHALAEAAQRERGIQDAASTDDDDGAARLDRDIRKRGRSRGLGEG
jgi:hypothetical protein